VNDLVALNVKVLFATFVRGMAAADEHIA